jgi:hypothetical protein
MLKKFSQTLLWSIVGGLVGMLLQPTYVATNTQTDEFLVVALVLILFASPFVAGLVTNYRERKSGVKLDGLVIIVMATLGFILAEMFNLTEYVSQKVPLGLVVVLGFATFPVMGLALADAISETVVWARSRPDGLSISLPRRGTTEQDSD